MLMVRPVLEPGLSGDYAGGRDRGVLRPDEFSYHMEDPADLVLNGVLGMECRNETRDVDGHFKG